MRPQAALQPWRGKTHVLRASCNARRFWGHNFGSVLVAGLVGYVAYSVLASIAWMVGLAGLFSGIGFCRL